MRSPVLKVLALVALVVSCTAILSASCVASRVEPAALFGSASVAWPDVHESYDRGVTDALVDGDISSAEADDWALHGVRMDSAIDARDRVKLAAIPWVLMITYVDRGIQDELEDGEIGPNGAQLARDQLALFDETIARLTE